MRVLICDDEPDLRFLYKNVFELHGATVVEADNGQSCLDLAGRGDIDLIVLDLTMPVRDGLSVLPDLRLECPGVPVVVISAYLGDDVVAETARLGAIACYEKMQFLSHVPALLARLDSREQQA